MTKVESVVIIGAGAMGTGIAINVAAHGLPVHLIDVDPLAIDRAFQKAEAFFNRQVEKGRMAPDAAQYSVQQITGSCDFSNVSRADLVIEAVFEDIAIKRQTFLKLLPHLKADSIVATNTSALRLSDLADIFETPGQFIGLHYFSPAEINPLVEVARGANTAQATVDRAEDFLHQTGKTALHCKDQYGFAVNRFFCPFTNEAARLLDENLGTSSQIDVIAQSSFLAPIGPFAVMNIVKPRINYHAIRNLAPLGEFYAPAVSMIQVGNDDQLWNIGNDAPNPAAEEIIGNRLRGAVFLPVLQLIDEQVADPSSIDLGAEVALRFGRKPCALMDELGPDTVRRLIQPYCDIYGCEVPHSVVKVGRLVTENAEPKAGKVR